MAWDNPDDYAYLEDADGEQFAWEFIRRTEDYRKEWAETYRLMEEQGLLPDTNLDVFSPQYGICPTHIRTPRKNHWSLRFYHHPSVKEPAHLSFLPFYPFLEPIHPVALRDIEGEKMDAKRFFGVVIDVKKAKKVQMNAISDWYDIYRETFNKTQKVNKTHKNTPKSTIQTPTYILYLRLLDLVQHEARSKVTIKRSIVAETLNKHTAQPASDWFRDTKKSAIQMRDDGWKQLIA